MSGESSPSGQLDTRFSTPAPELDDHRRRLGRGSPIFTRSAMTKSPVVSPSTKLNLPALELQAATPAGSASGRVEPQQLDDALRPLELSPVARDFEQAVDSDSDDDGDGANGRRGVARRDARRGRRPRDLLRHDKSRDTSSSRSTSPANSVEAFAEPRRRPRGNTLDSHASLGEFAKYRTGQESVYDAGTRRPTLSNISVPPALTHRTNEQIPDDLVLDLDEEPGKTYVIDFEELDEFVALCAQGKILDQYPTNSDATVSGEDRKVFEQIGAEQGKNDVYNAALNPDTFFEKPVGHHNHYHHHGSISTSSSPQILAQPQKSKIDQSVQRFTFFSSEIPESKRGHKLGDLVDGDVSFRDLFDIGPEGGVWWLDVLNPTRAELEVIAKAFKIHRLTREDIETEEPREKVELFSQYYFVSFRSFNPDKHSEDFLDPLHIYIVVTADGVLSFSRSSNNHTKNVQRRIRKLGDFLSLGPDYICYAMIDDIVDSFAPIINEAEVESENIEDQVFTARQDDYLTLLRQIGECRKRVLNMMRLLGGKADVIKGFAKRCNEQFQIAPRGDIGLYLGDIQDHVVTMMSNLGHVEKMLSRSHANYLAQLNVNSIMQGTHSNKNLAKITVVATIVVPLNIITGLFGMNVHIPGQGVPGYGWFGGILGAMVTFVCVTLFLAKKFRYI